MHSFRVIVLLATYALCITGQQVPWTGPIADHVNGQLVADTVEVAEAKRQHLTAFARVRASLPELPADQVFPLHQVNIPVTPPPAVFVPQPQQQPLIPQPIISQSLEGHPVRTWTQFAEEIPRSDIGEVPEVALARKNHLKALSEARAALPPLMTVEPVAQRSLGVQQPQWTQLNAAGFQQDTPEVAAAKLEHARLVAAAGRR